MKRALWQFPDVAAALEAENAPPDSIEMDRNDGRIDALHDALVASPEGEKLSDARHLPFGKNANHLTVANRVACRSQGADHVAWPLLGRNRNGASCPGEQADQGPVVETFVD